MSDRHEMPLELARRHVREGEKRVARQDKIVIDLERDHHAGAAALGRLVLGTFRTSLELQKHHLRQIEERLKR